jgi:hypothetical protein
MYTNYQNRMVAAREVFSQAKLNYDNSIKEAKLQNNSVLAEIAFQTLQTTLQLGLDNAMYNNQLILDKANQKIELENAYWQRSQDVLNQINTENALAENVRQYEKNYELQIKEFNEQVRQYEQSYKQQVKEFEEGIRQFNEEIARLKKQDAFENKVKIQQLELAKQELAESKRQADLDYKLKQEQLAEEKRQYDKTYALQKKQYAASSKSSGSSGGGGGTVNKTNNGFVDKVTSVAKNAVNGLAALGYGPVTDSRLAELIANGEVVRYVENGVVKYKAGPNHKSKKTSAAAAQKVWQGITRLTD